MIYLKPPAWHADDRIRNTWTTATFFLSAKEWREDFGKTCECEQDVMSYEKRRKIYGRWTEISINRAMWLSDFLISVQTCYLLSRHVSCYIDSRS